MKARFEQARSSGESPENIEQQMKALVREESRRQIPPMVAKARSWWWGFRNFLIVGSLAFGLAIGLALWVEHRYAAPLCERYAAEHGLAYWGLDYPVLGKSSSTTSPSGTCLLLEASGRQRSVDLTRLEPNSVKALLASFALQMEVTMPVSFVLLALLAVGAAKLRR